VRLEQRLVGHDRHAALGQRGDDLRLRLRHLLDRAEQLEVDGADARDDADVRPGDGTEFRDLAEAAHAHLADDDLRVGLDARERHRQADLVVVTALSGDRVRLRPAQRGEDVLGRRLPGRAGDADNPRRRAGAHCAAEGGESGEGVVGVEHRGRPPRERVPREVGARADGDEQVPLGDPP
jgi:hypothetical protein